MENKEAGCREEQSGIRIKNDVGININHDMS
jgi:hypothetical protein